MSAFPKSFMSFFSLVFSIILSLLSAFQTIGTPVTGSIPVEPGNFVPIIRFVACSDIHDATDRLEDLIQTAYALYDNDDVYSGIDALVIAGDFTNSGTREQLQGIKDTLDDNLREGTERVICLGNHEFSSDKATTYTKYREIFGEEPNVTKVINGVYFIAVSYDENKSYASPGTKAFARKQIAAAAEANAKMPIITVQHPHPTATVYGSVNWGDPNMNTIWDNYSQVINFSGHSHYPINDPRSIWQGGYTALGCGTLKYYELENELVAGQFPTGNDNAQTAYIVEIDANGSTLIKCFDLYTKTFFGQTYYIETPSDKTTFSYTYRNMMTYDEAPVFSNDAAIATDKDEEGNTLISFPAATDKFIVHDYKISVKSSLGISKYSDSLLSDYYFADTPTSYTVNVGKLEAGKEYTVSVHAANAYAELSCALTTTFTAQ